ncbi:MAG: hypothetical protein AAF430_11025 [Myxococcota bacterium]
MDARWRWLAAGVLLLGCFALRVAAVYTTAFNWDEFALLDGAARSAFGGALHSGGHAGLPETLLMPWVSACLDEIHTARGARLAWLVLTWTALAGLFVALRELLPEGPTRTVDAALGTALLGAIPVFLEWSLQIRTDQIALCGGTWGIAGLLLSRRRPVFAVLAGIAFGMGFIGSQKLGYLAALGLVLAAGDLLVHADLRPKREALRLAIAGAAAAAIVVGWRLFVLAAFEVPAHHSARAAIAPSTTAGYLNAFDFYRATIGYSQYRTAAGSFLPHFVGLAAMLGVSLAVPRARSRRLALAWVVLALGLAVASFHAAAFAYFLMTLGVFFAVALTLAIPSLRRAAETWPELGHVAPAVAWGALALAAGLHTAGALRDTQLVQAESLRFVHRNFAPERAGFHPEKALFCGVDQPLGLWFSQRIYRAFEGPDKVGKTARLLESFRTEPIHYLVQSFRLNQFPLEIRQFWADHYQPYRNAVFVAGRQLRGERDETTSIGLIVPGLYRWLPAGSAAPVWVGETRVGAGEIVSLAAGDHPVRFETDGTRGALMLAVDDPPGPAPLAFYKSY